MAEAALANDATARTETGALKDQTSTAIPEPTTTADPSKTDPSTTKPNTDPSQQPSLLNEKPDAKPAGSPETYADFKAPEGFEFNKERLAEASSTFKELGLSQDQAQKVMDLYGKAMQESGKSSYELWSKTQTEWRNEVMQSDLGPQIDQVKSTISKGLDAIGNPQLVEGFKKIMDLSGAGNNINFVRTFYALSKLVTEGGNAAASRPSAAGQPSDQQRPRTAAQAMYPKLPTSG